ncbi:RNA polymerase I-specific transcription initiation factor RRN3 [Leucoagaricus sp. SymC.cos]|nr:RNA polymerase I-specific transcription initiation factor RRN3 [Leucoagaricus sp. SymC.cos]
MPPPIPTTRKKPGSKLSGSTPTSTPLVRRPIATNSRIKQNENYRKDMYLAFVNNALQQKMNGNSQPFDELVNQFNPKRRTDPSSADVSTSLRTWILALTHVVSRLERAHSTLVEAVINMPWTTLDSSTVKSFIVFTGMLLSARPEYLSLVLGKIAQGFTYQFGLQTLSQAFPEGSSSPITRRTVYDRLHYLLQHLLSLIPTLPSTLQPLLVRNFPHKRQNQLTQTVYIRNLLRVSLYCPELSEKILATIVDRAIQMDVEIQVELEELEEEKALEDQPLFDIDPFDDMVKKLDAILVLVLANTMRIQFNVLLSIFDRTILHTFKSRYTQFLLFWYASLDPEFADEFQGEQSFHNEVPHAGGSTITRAAAASYIGSFVSRALFVDGEGARRVMAVLCEFLKAHLDEVEESIRTYSTPVTVGGHQHTVFYAITQAVFLIFCFRWRDLLDDLEDEEGESSTHLGVSTDQRDSGVDGKARKWMPELGVLQRVVSSVFNPLRVCSVNVVMQFARVAQATDFIYCYTILESNRRLEHAGASSSTRANTGTSTLDQPRQPPTMLLALDRSESRSATAELNTFFPFDPYRLPRSAIFIKDVYREWASVAIDSESDDEESDEGVEEEETDYGDGVMSSSPGQERYLRVTIPQGNRPRLGGEDDVTGGLGESLEQMNISPRLHETTSASVLSVTTCSVP